MSYKQISPLPVQQGGTNATTLANTNGTTYFDGTSVVTVAPGASGHVLTSSGPGGAPAYQSIDPSGTNVISFVDGNGGTTVAPVLRKIKILGGNGVTTTGAGDTLTVDSSALTTAATSSGSATASSNTITFVGTGTVTTSATGSTVTINGSGGGGGGITWNDQTATTVTMSVNNAYSVNNAAIVTLTLPVTAAVGSIVQVSGFGAGGWRISQNTSQVIHFGAVDTNIGTSGSLLSTSRYDQITLVCAVANTDWVVNSSLGMITYV